MQHTEVNLWAEILQRGWIDGEEMVASVVGQHPPVVTWGKLSFTVLQLTEGDLPEADCLARPILCGSCVFFFCSACHLSFLL